MKHAALVLSLFWVFLSIAQNEILENHFKTVDSLYREDQIYVGLNVNFLLNRPSGMRQSGFSGGLNFGFIRDMPINSRRNVSIGLGLGLSLNTYTQNLFIGEDINGKTTFDVLDNNVNFNENRFSTQVVEIPLHFRWRTSNIGDDSSFWRIYSGINFGYLYRFKSVYRENEISVEQTNLNELNRVRYAFYFAFGKSKINFFFKYNLNSLFDGRLQNRDEPVEIDEIKAGLVFYIL